MPEGLSANSLKAIAEFIKSDYEGRKRDRSELEAHWDEIDRQIEMRPLPRETQSGNSSDWYPALESSLQFNALEVIAADARRLKFPRGTEWFTVLANLDDEYLERWDRRRLKFPIIGGQPTPIKLDQETANSLVKATLDHYHRLYDFRGAIDTFDAEMIKYGTGAVRVREIELAAFRQEFRGVSDRNLIGPAVVPCSIRNTYLESSAMLLHEGLSIAPSVIRCSEQLLDEVKRSARLGGEGRGWLVREVEKLDPEKDPDQRGFVKLLEFEGDLIVPRTSTNLFLPGYLCTIVVGGQGPRVIRLKETKKSYVVGNYMRHDPLSPYGVSPLMKGRPGQEAVTEVFNDLLAAARLNALPPIKYDAHDPNFQATGGPEIYPGAKWAADAPDRTEAVQIGDLAGLLNSYAVLVKQYEDLTGVNDPRRGAQIKSHTSATSTTIEAERGVARTDDFVSSIEYGPLRTILYMEFEIARRVLTKEIPIPMSAAGMEGYVNIGKDDLADEATFFVHGSEGAIEERNKLQQFMLATQQVVQMVPLAAQLAQAGLAVPLNIDFEALANEIYQRAGIQNTTRFIRPGAGRPDGSQAEPGSAPGAPGVQAGAAAPVSDGSGRTNGMAGSRPPVRNIRR